MAEFNIIDPEAIASYLDGFFLDDPVAARHLNTALGRALRKEESACQQVIRLPERAPDWLRAKWPEGGPYYRFAPDEELTRRVKHVADWIKGAVAESDDWLADVDEKDRPRKLLKLGSLEQAEGEADKAMHLKNQRLASRLVPDGEGEKTVMAMPDGYRIVQLTSEPALEREGVGMGHCIGQGGYDDALYEGSRQFFSLRDSNNKPHVTFEVDPSENVLLQCKGKGNNPPAEKYKPYVQAFVRDRRYHLQESMGHTGLIEQDGEYYEINHLPENFHYHGDLNLGYTQITSLPKGLKVSGHLNLGHTPIALLPEDLRVGDDLFLDDSQITSLPKGLQVRGNLNLSHTPITSLPEGFAATGCLDLSGTRIVSLPEGLQVGGNLHLSHTPIASLPKRLKVAKSLYLGYTLIDSLPENLQVGSLYLNSSRATSLPDGMQFSNLFLNGSLVTSLPEGLREVSGHLYLSHTSISSLPEGLKKVGGNLGVSHTPIASLPMSLQQVGGDLDISDTSITSLPEGLQIDGDLKLSREIEIPQSVRIAGKVIIEKNSSKGFAHREEARRQGSGKGREPQ